MKKITILRKTGFLMLITLLISTESWAATYTATTSGNWSATTTWAGGIAPGDNITSDAITINSGVTVTMDNNVAISGALASLSVLGSLTSGSYDLTINSLATLSGTGTIAIDGITLQTGAISTFTGSATVNTFTSSMASLQLGGSLTVNQTLNLDAGSLSLLSTSTLSMGDNTNIILAGGALSAGSGTITLGNNYNVSYLSAGSTGIELTGAGLNNVTVNTSGMVSLSGSATINGTLTLTSGTLNLNGNSLTLSGNVAASGSGSLQSNSSSNLTINGSGGIAGTLNFTGSSSLNNLTLNVGSGNQAQIGGTLDVTGALQLNSGALTFPNSTLTLSGSVSGSGSLSGSNSSNLIVNSSGSLSGSLNFTSDAQSLNNLTINVGSGNTASLGSNLTVGGALTLSNSSVLSLGSSMLTLNGSLSGSGSFSTSGNSSLVINISGSATIVDSGAIGTLVINSGSGMISLGGHLSVTNSLNLQSGTLVLNGNDLTISGNIAAGGSGSISSTSSSNLTLNGSGNIAGTLNFTGSSSLNNLTLNIGSDNQAQIGGTLDIIGTLQLISGTLAFPNSTLTLSGSISGSGSLSGSSSSNIVINSSGNLSGNLNFASGAQSLNNLTINVGSGNTASLGSNLTVGGALTLSNGSILSLGSSMLTLNGSLSGSGSFSTNSNSGLIINISGGSTTIATSGTIGTLVINTTGSGSVSLNNSVAVSGSLNLQSGTLILNSNDLTINGNVTSGGSGSISSTSSSSITITGNGSISGALSFVAGGNTVNNFSINIGSGNSVSLGSNLQIAGTLTLNGGMINTGTNGLTVLASGWVSGGDSTSYVTSSGTGYLSLNMAASSTSWVTFPVGTSAHFSPVALQLSSGSASTDVQISAIGEVLADGTTGVNISSTQPLVDVTYNIEPTVTTGVNLNMQLMWSSALEVNGFNHSSAYISHFVNGHWDTYTLASATVQTNGMYSLERDNISSFSPFAVFDQNTETGVSVVINVPFEVYPNPVSDNLVIINQDASNTKVNMDIIGMDGRILSTYILTDGTSNIPVQNLASGDYIIKVYNSDKVVIKKVTKI